MSETLRLIEEHTKEMVNAGMGYALAKLAEDPGWLGRMDRSGSLGHAVEPDAAAFMKYRGNFAAASIAAEIEALA